MSDPDTALSETKRLSIWTRLLIGLAVFLTILMMVGLGIQQMNRARIESQYQALLRKLDETDPGWKLEDLESARPTPPENENSARVIVLIPTLLPRVWPEQKLSDGLSGYEPYETLPAEVFAHLQKDLQANHKAVATARRLINMPTGKHHLEFPTNPIVTILKDQQDTRQVAQLLSYDSWRRAMSKDYDGALDSARAIINAGRSLDDEPTIISQLVRVACLAIGLGNIERTLALGQAGDKALQQVQQLLTLEEKHPTYLVCMRGERAMQFQIWAGLYNGTIGMKEVFMKALKEGGWIQRWMGWSKQDFRRHQLKAMELFNKMVEIAKLPEHEQNAANLVLDAEIAGAKKTYPLLEEAVGSASMFSRSFRRKSAQVRCMLAILAVERFRLKHNKWPATLKDVVPAFLDAEPLDPEDGKPLRYKIHSEGVIVYSIGEDGVDNGGAGVGKPPIGTGVDIGYRLWNLDKRRQTPKPRPKQEVPMGGPAGAPGGM